MNQIIISSHAQHVEILKRVEPFTKFVEIVSRYAGALTDELTTSLAQFLVETKEVWEWAGTISKGAASTLYRYSYDEALFQNLREYEGFFIHMPYRNSSDDFINIPDSVVLWQMRYTSFGDKDIAFFDENNDLLFYTVTHEGYAFIDEKLGWHNENL